MCHILNYNNFETYCQLNTVIFDPKFFQLCSLCKHFGSNTENYLSHHPHQTHTNVTLIFNHNLIFCFLNLYRIKIIMVFQCYLDCSWLQDFHSFQSVISIEIIYANESVVFANNAQSVMGTCFCNSYQQCKGFEL